MAEPEERRSPWKITAGAAYRSLGGIHFDTGSHSPAFALPRLGRSGGQYPGAIGGFADRTYNDGYVFKDDGTGDPNSLFPELTWYWGYQNDAQVSGDSLLFHTTGIVNAFSQSKSRQNGDWDDEAQSAAPYLEAGYFFDLNPQLRVGPSVSFMFMSFDSDKTVSTFAARQVFTSTQFTQTDTFALDGVVPPPAPYAGDLAGPGPLIPNIPASRGVSKLLIGNQTADFRNRVHQSIDVNLYTFSIGPSLEYTRGCLALTGQTGLALNIADTKADFRETLSVTRNGKTKTLRRWSAHDNRTDILPGFYLQGSAGCKLGERWTVSAFGRYDWTKDLTGEVGPSSYRLDLDGWTVGGQLALGF